MLSLILTEPAPGKALTGPGIRVLRLFIARLTLNLISKGRLGFRVL